MEEREKISRHKIIIIGLRGNKNKFLLQFSLRKEEKVLVVVYFCHQGSLIKGGGKMGKKVQIIMKSFLTGEEKTVEEFDVPSTGNVVSICRMAEVRAGTYLRPATGEYLVRVVEVEVERNEEVH